MPGDYSTIEQVLQNDVIAIVRDTWAALAAPYKDTGDYIEGLFKNDSIEYIFEGKSMQASVINRSAHAAVVEFGHQGFHLPSRVRVWKYRVTKGPRAGIGYVRVPFRHFTPGTTGSSGRALRGAMPEDIYARAKQLTQNQRIKDMGDLYRQSKSYLFYRQADKNFPRGLLARARTKEGQPGYTWRSSKYEGMQRAPQVTKKVNQGTYITYRTMTQDSAGWYIPALAGKNLAQETVQKIAPAVKELIGQAAAQDTADSIITTLSVGGLQVNLEQ